MFKEWLMSETQDNRILFYSRDRDQYGFLSNFHLAPFELDGQRWPSVEHYYVASKTTNPLFAQEVLKMPKPGQVKRLGQAIQLRPDWEQVKLRVMYRAVMAKFTQNPALAQALKATGNAELVEDSPRDAIWGAGADGRGKNWLGRILMRVRSQI